MILLKLKQVVELVGRCRTSLYADIADGTFPPPVKWGVRSSHWPSDEVEAVVRARIAGKSEAKIKVLVIDLVAARQLAA